MNECLLGIGKHSANGERAVMSVCCVVLWPHPDDDDDKEDLRCVMWRGVE